MRNFFILFCFLFCLSTPVFADMGECDYDDPMDTDDCLELCDESRVSMPLSYTYCEGKFFECDFTTGCGSESVVNCAAEYEANIQASYEMCKSSCTIDCTWDPNDAVWWGPRPLCSEPIFCPIVAPPLSSFSCEDDCVRLNPEYRTCYDNCPATIELMWLDTYQMYDQYCYGNCEIYITFLGDWSCYSTCMADWMSNWDSEQMMIDCGAYCVYMYL